MNRLQQFNLLANEQFRVRKLQVFNWGTFSDLHTIPIAEKGFLFTGRSGSGKSTLLDAFSTLLVPPRSVNFNAAAQESERSGRDRNLVTYIRGAWAEQKDDASGEIAMQYLRPNTTWSALALTYNDGINRTVVLVQLFWLKGNSNANSDVQRYYLIFERPFNLQEISDFNLDVRKLKQSFPGIFIQDNFISYSERFRHLLGIKSELALRLLHKTQAAKNLGDLNSLLRDFMLDVPETFKAAERLVDEFTELDIAYQAVVTARKQVHTLLPARVAHQNLLTLMQEISSYQELLMGIDVYKENYRIELLQQRLAELHVQAEGLANTIQSQESLLSVHKATLRDLQQQQQALGGNQIEQWEADKTNLERQREQRLAKRQQAQEACHKLDWLLPDSPNGFAELVNTARQEVENWQRHSSNLQERKFILDREKTEVVKQFSAARNEITALRRQPSNIPADMLELRRSIATAIGLPESALPFAGELIEVYPQEAQWQGAIERLLHSFALSLLVNELHYSALSTYINTINLGGRLVYYRITQPVMAANKALVANSLVHKLNIKQGDYAIWLELEIKQRFDYACVDTLQAFRNTERAITREGQIRHSKTRHEKDDRKRIDDRRHWVLGFDNREKLALFEQQAQQLADTISRLTQELETLTEEDQQRANKAMQCQLLANIQWQEIELAPLLERITKLTQQIQEVRTGNTALQKIAQRIEQQTRQISEAENSLTDARADKQVVIKEIENKNVLLQNLQQDCRLQVALTPHQQQGLAACFAELNQPLQLDTLDSSTNLVERQLKSKLEVLSNQNQQINRQMESCFADFKRNWPAEASDMDTSLASAADFMAKLQRLESDGLPTHEQRFFELLKSQSQQNLTALATYLNQAYKTILERLELVNQSLSQTPFNPGTYLHIESKDRQLAAVREFRQELRQAQSYVLTDDKAQAEDCFRLLCSLIERLKSQELEQRRWRETVLDVRQHLEFIGCELDSEGKEIETYRSGAGKSGGQRQKLATTCLAAALRYQLSDTDQQIPTYAPVVLDEAFDKADNEFTTLAMNIFANFGFQMIVATPLKSVMTLEPFIGGACLVDISERRCSSVLMIEYDAKRHSLKLPDGSQQETALAVS